MLRKGEPLIEFELLTYYRSEALSIIYQLYDNWSDYSNTEFSDFIIEKDTTVSFSRQRTAFGSIVRSNKVTIIKILCTLTNQYWKCINSWNLGYQQCQSVLSTSGKNSTVKLLFLTRTETYKDHRCLFTCIFIDIS